MEILVHKKDNSKCLLECEYSVALELNEYFSHFAPNYKFHPLYKQKRWNGKIYLFNLKSREFPLGLLTELYEFCQLSKYTLKIDDNIKECFIGNSSKEDFEKNIKSFPISSGDSEITYRDYQILGIWEAIKSKRKIFVSPTASGKSLIIYGISRILQNIIENKILIVVPSVILVEQMYNDFNDYAFKDEEWFATTECTKIHSGIKYDDRKQIVISTWQSLQNKELDFFEQFDGVIVDETHQAGSKEISRVVNACVNAQYRFGFTGTMPKDKLSQLTIKGLFGPVKTLQTSKKAMEDGYISNLKIHCLALEWDEQTSKIQRKNHKDYIDEVNFICASNSRNDFICKLAKELKGNTLILTARVESHGKILYNLLKEKTGKEVFYIFGEVPADERERIRKMLETKNDCIIIGNFQILSTGWSVKNIHNGIFAFPTKSFVRVVQSIGRGLRLNNNKDIFTLYDLADNFQEKNMTWKHFLNRCEIYAEQEFDWDVNVIPLKE